MRDCRTPAAARRGKDGKRVTRPIDHPGVCAAPLQEHAGIRAILIFIKTISAR
jgi:hypothetical protein